jgi:hypothetical protein
VGELCRSKAAVLHSDHSVFLRMSFSYGEGQGLRASCAGFHMLHGRHGQQQLADSLGKQMR